MRIPRLGRVTAIARRDLAMELRGGRGWVLPAVMAALLGPAATIPFTRPHPPPVAVRGDVPEAVRSIATIRDDAPTAFRADPDGGLAVSGPVPAAIRRALDGDAPTVRVVYAGRPVPVPGRTALLALIASSTLTGAIAGSIPGERAARTLAALLSAAVSREEIALGKWLAWGGTGAFACLLAAVGGVAAGTVSPGPWMLALPFVPLGTVAFGLWLVRTAGDALSGSTTSIRVVPAVVGGLALAAWGVGLKSPILGACVPIGGAVLASGSTWGAGWGLPILASASTAITSGAWLLATARDLDESPAPRPWPWPAAVAAAAGVGAATSWAALFPWLWRAANPNFSSPISASAGVWSAAALGAWAAAVGHARLSGVPDVVRASRGAWIVPIALLLALAGGDVGAGGWAGLTVLLFPPPGWAALALVLADEALYRHVFRRWLGTPGAAIAWTLARAPSDPLLGLASGLGLGWLAEWHWGAAVTARFLWLCAAAALPELPGGPFFTAATIAALLVTGSRYRAGIPPRAPAPAA